MTGVSILSNVTTGVRAAVEIAWGADLTDLTGASWVWTDVTTDVDVSSNGIVNKIGRSDESQVTQPSTFTVILDNSSGKYSLGPQSANYPNVRRNTPVRYRLSLNSGSTWNVRFQGNAVGFTPNWDTTGRYATVTLVASDGLRQLNQGSLPATSYYAQTVPISTGSGQLFEGLQYYWNNEGGNGFEGSNGISSCYPIYPTGVTSSTDTRVMVPNRVYLPNTIATTNASAFPISGPIPSAWDFSAGYSGGLPSTTSTGALTIRWMCAFSSLSGTQSQPVIYWKTSASSTLSWAIYWNQNGDLWVTNGTNGTANNGYTGTGVAFAANGKAWYMNLQMSTNGSGSTIRLDAMSFDGSSAGFTWSATGSTTGYLTAINFIGPNINDGSSTPVMEAHMTVQNIAADPVTPLAAFYKGNPGELVTDRLTRLCAVANIPFSILTDTATETSSNPADTMGGQFYDTTSNLIRECEATGFGALYGGLGIGLTYITRLRRLSQQPTMTVDASAVPSAVVMPFAPIDDDQLTVNQASVARRNGLTNTYTSTASANAIGVYSTSLAVNPQTDAPLPSYARWLVAQGTLAGYRYPTFTFELEKVPSLLSSWVGVIPTCRIDVTNIGSARSQHPAGTIKNVLEGWTETVTQHRYVVEANCTTWQAWNVATLAAATGTTVDTVGRYESDGSTVTTTVSAGATSLSVTTSSGPKWTTSSVTADDFPLTVSINGNPITVTAISSTTSPQTFTVSAVPYAITAGSAVTVYQNAVLGM